VADEAAREARVLRVGTLTSIGRALYPAIIDHFAKRQPGWQVELRSFGWRRDERRPAVRDFVRACRDAAGT